jgi:hypothetical protein
MTPYIRTIAHADGWELHVDYAGVEHVLGAPKRNGRRKARIGAHDCKVIEERLRRAAVKFGWAAAIQAETDGVDLFEVAMGNVKAPAEPEAEVKQLGLEGV